MGTSLVHKQSSFFHFSDGGGNTNTVAPTAPQTALNLFLADKKTTTNAPPAKGKLRKGEPNDFSKVKQRIKEQREMLQGQTPSVVGMR